MSLQLRLRVVQCHRIIATTLQNTKYKCSVLITRLPEYALKSEQLIISLDLIDYLLLSISRSLVLVVGSTISDLHLAYGRSIRSISRTSINS